MRSGEKQDPQVDAPDPAGGRARRRLDEEMISRFGLAPSATVPAGFDGEQAGASAAATREPDEALKSQDDAE